MVVELHICTRNLTHSWDNIAIHKHKKLSHWRTNGQIIQTAYQLFLLLPSLEHVCKLTNEECKALNRCRRRMICTLARKCSNSAELLLLFVLLYASTINEEPGHEKVAIFKGMAKLKEKRLLKQIRPASSNHMISWGILSSSL